jgi:hypothetical protein
VAVVLLLVHLLLPAIRLMLLLLVAVAHHKPLTLAPARLSPAVAAVQVTLASAVKAADTLVFF